MTTVSDLGERALIERIRDRVPPPPGWLAVGIGDDAAVLETERNSLEVVTADSLVEGVHFDRAFVPPSAIGHRALAANLSDIASMGARPRAAVLSLALPDTLPVADFDGLIDGVLALAAVHRVALIGGNIARSPGPLVVDMTLLGAVQKRRMMRRAGARPGDLIYVSGEVGLAAAGLELCRAGAGPAEAASEEMLRRATARFLTPEPRVRVGWLLARNRIATACVDLSDGLADAIRQMTSASGVGAIVNGDAVPLSPELGRWFERQGRDPLTAALVGGDDYELLFTVPARRRRLAETLERGMAGVPLTRIGVITRSADVVLKRGAEAGSHEPLPQGYVHFR